MKIKIILSFLIVLNFLSHSVAFAQSHIRLLGVVKDTTNAVVIGVNIHLVIGKDTLESSTDAKGKFSFTIPKGEKVMLLTQSIGYLPFTKTYSIDKDQKVLQLPVVVLQSSPNQLKEVRIKAKLIPIRLMKDTIEFNANAYVTHEQDRVTDLLKQLPGVIVGSDGEVSMGGKSLTKLRVNGKDFFTGNVKEFISQLPAGLVAKVQVIDDYGDKASFTGVKSGEPKKMLNLVLKPNHNGGNFGNVTASAGTNDRYGLNLNGNTWEGARQINVNSNANTLNNGAGVNTNANLGASYRNTIGKKLNLSSGYNYGFNKSANAAEDYMETVNPLGTIYNQSKNETSNKNNTHNLYLNLESQDQNNFIQGNISGSLAGTSGNNLSASQQSGLIKQDLNTISSLNQHNPNVNGALMMSRKLKKPGRIVSLSINATTADGHSSNNLNNQIGYFNPSTGESIKDSILNQLVDTRNHNTSLSSSFSFIEPLRNRKDSLIKKYIDFTYIFSLTHGSNGLETSVVNPTGESRKVDSLSNAYGSTFIQHNIGINYRYESEKVNYTLGINAQPYLLKGGYEGRSDRINRPGFTVFPAAQLSITPSHTNTYSFYYSENTVTPNFSQLQPIPDTRDLQNVQIGNPNLKAALSHTVNLNYRHVNIRNGSSLQIGISGNATQNQVVSNTVLVSDTLNSLKQQTRFQNTNGNYNLNSNYFWSLPLDKNKYNITAGGSMGYSHRVAFSNGVKNFTKGVVVNEFAGLRINQKWIALALNTNYNYTNNSYSVATAAPNVIQTWLFSSDAKFFILSSLSAAVTAVKTINSGYSLPGANTLLLGGYIEELFLKKKQLSVKVEVNDLLDQANNLHRTISDNTITDSRTNQRSRYFMLSLSWRLQDFGKY